MNQETVDWFYRQYKMNCITTPTLYNSNYQANCSNFTERLKTALKNGYQPSELTPDDYNNLLTTLDVKVIEQDMTDLGNKYLRYKMNCKAKYSTDAERDRENCDSNTKELVELFSTSVVDTIGLNKDDPTKWAIPDGEFRPFLTELRIVKPYKQNIKDIIQHRMKSKSLLYNLKKTTGIGGKTKRRRNRKSRKSRKSRKHYKRRRSR